MSRSVYLGPAQRGGPATPDWRLELPEWKRRPVRVWLWSGAVLTFLILVVGGITRLTQSGLSIVDWQPLMGVIPPLNDAQWQEAFDRYRQFPEYQLLRRGMSMAEFQFIFFWEYIHRVLARVIGLVFLIPFLYFLVRGYLNRPLVKRSLVLFGLGALQGFMGWYMVKSGLVDQPHVSHYRLAAHLSIAFAIFGCCVWFARDLALRSPAAAAERDARRGLIRGLYLVGGLLAVQVFWGALVAGLKAGRIFTTFPLMGGGLVPPNVMGMDPPLLNLIANPITVQWMHRVLGTLLALAVVALFVRVWNARGDGGSLGWSAALLSLVLVQYLLGVLTLIYAVPVSLGVIHQAVAMVIFGVWLGWLHHVRNEGESAPTPAGVVVPSERAPSAAPVPTGRG